MVVEGSQSSPSRRCLSLFQGCRLLPAFPWKPTSNDVGPRTPVFLPPAMAKDTTTTTTFQYDELGPHEIFWRDCSSFLQGHGYQLRPRFQSGWVPSWTGTSKDPMYFEDSHPLRVRRFPNPNSCYPILKYIRCSIPRLLMQSDYMIISTSLSSAFRRDHRKWISSSIYPIRVWEKTRLTTPSLCLTLLSEMKSTISLSCLFFDFSTTRRLSSSTRFWTSFNSR